MEKIRDLEVPDIDDIKVWDVIAGLYGYQGFLFAYDIGLFSYLNDGPKTFTEITERLKLEKRPTEALLSTCVRLEFIKINKLSSINKYELTEVSKYYLVKSSPFFFGAAFDLAVNNFIAYNDVKKAMLTNKPTAYDGKDIFETHEKQEELAKNFTIAMHSASMAPALCWPKKIDLSQYSKFLDIGGGSGAHTIGALSKWENLSGIVLDLGPVCEVCEEILAKSSLDNRAKTHTGDFWECEFPDADVHFYSQIFHDWGFEKCEYLAEKSFKALPKNGKIIIHEILMNNDMSGPFMASALSISMLAWTEGKQYSGLELSNMLDKSGFRSVEIIPTFGYWSIVVGTK